MGNATAFEHVYRLPYAAMSYESDGNKFSQRTRDLAPILAAHLGQFVNAMADRQPDEDQALALRIVLSEHARRSLEPFSLAAWPYGGRTERARESLSLLLILACPNLHTLDVIPTLDDIPNVRSSLGRLLLETTSYFQNSICANLRTVHWRTIEWTNLNAILPFMCLPSVRLISVERCYHPDESIIQWPSINGDSWSGRGGPPLSTKSYVTSVDLTQSFVPRSVIHAIAELFANDCHLRISSPQPEVEWSVPISHWMSAKKQKEISWDECKISPSCRQTSVDYLDDGTKVVNYRSRPVKVDFYHQGEMELDAAYFDGDRIDSMKEGRVLVKLPKGNLADTT